VAKHKTKALEKEQEAAEKQDKQEEAASLMIEPEIIQF